MNTRLPYKHLFTIGIREAFVYQADFYMRLLSSIVLVVAQYFLWRAIFYNQAYIGNFSLQEIVTYMALVWITQGFSDTVWMARNLQNKILSGAIAHELLYPLNYPVYTLVLIYTKSLLYLAISGIPTFVTAVILFKIQLPTLWNAGLFLLSLHFSFLINAALSSIMGWISVYLHNIEGLLQLEGFFHTLFSGALLPLSLLPPFITALARLLPFQGVVMIPLMIYLGKLQSWELIRALASQVLWGILLWAGMMVLYGQARKNLKAFGG